MQTLQANCKFLSNFPENDVVIVFLMYKSMIVSIMQT